MGKRTRRVAATQRSLEFRPPSRRNTRNKRKPRRKLRLASLLFLIGAGVLAAGSWKVHQLVFDLRLRRASQMALKVLEQTQRPQPERLRYATIIARNCLQKALNPAVVSAIVVVESSGNPLTVSPSGDLGLMQVNARIHARDFNFEKRNLLNPDENIDVGTTILKGMVDRHGEEKAIQAYNGLVPEKRDYSVRVRAVLDRAGLSEQSDSIGSNPGFHARLSDWLAAARIATGP